MQQEDLKNYILNTNTDELIDLLYTVSDRLLQINSWKDIEGCKFALDIIQANLNFISYYKPIDLTSIPKPIYRVYPCKCGI